MHPMTSVIFAVAAFAVLLNASLFVQLPSMVFYPDKKLLATPADWGLEYENVDMVAKDGTRLHGWFLPNAQTDRVLLFFHGNAGNISHRGESIQIFHRLGLNILIIDYRGYGQSNGSPSEQGLYQDAEAAWNYLTDIKNYPPENIAIFGRSLGGTVAAHLASNTKPGGLILESTMSSVRDFARVVYPVLIRMVALRYSFNVSEYLQSVTCPVLVLHSPDDEIMPYSLGEKVFQSAREPKVFFKLKGNHNSGFMSSQPAYEQALGTFIQANIKTSGKGSRGIVSNGN